MICPLRKWNLSRGLINLLETCHLTCCSWPAFLGKGGPSVCSGLICLWPPCPTCSFFLPSFCFLCLPSFAVLSGFYFSSFCFPFPMSPSFRFRQEEIPLYFSPSAVGVGLQEEERGSVQLHRAGEAACCLFLPISFLAENLAFVEIPGLCWAWGGCHRAVLWRNFSSGIESTEDLLVVWDGVTFPKLTIASTQKDQIWGSVTDLSLWK